MQKKTDILSQNTSAGLRKLELHWLLGLSSIFLLGAVGAFAIAPQNLPLDVPTAEIVEDVALPDLSEPSLNTIKEQGRPLLSVDQVRRDDTLSTLLDRMNIRNPEAIAFLRNDRDAQVLATQLRPGRTLISKTTLSGELLELHFQIDTSHGLVINKSSQGYVAQQQPLTVQQHIIVKSAEIQSSLFAATDQAGIPDQIATQIAEIFSSDIDFNSDLRRGDRFTVVYEESFSNGEPIKSGKVLSTEFINQGKSHEAVLYKTADGKENYFSAEGKNLQKAFLRSPLEFSRISSGFSLARLHPVLNTLRAHRGVDYAAPIGTRVRSVSDATVTFVGQQGGFGNVVILQHANGISTVYGHLSRFATGLRRGQKVNQGQEIGFVGMTGLATGPHLHYEFRVNGEHRDPLKVALPTATPLPADEMSAFRDHSQPLLEQLALLRGSNLASLE